MYEKAQEAWEDRPTPTCEHGIGPDDPCPACKKELKAEAQHERRLTDQWCCLECCRLGYPAQGHAQCTPTPTCGVWRRTGEQEGHEPDCHGTLD